MLLQRKAKISPPAERNGTQPSFLAAVLNHARLRQLLSREHFSVDGTLIEAWASIKSFRPKNGADEPPGGGRNGNRDFHGEPRRNDTHASTIDAEARPFRKGAGKEAKLCFMVHLVMEDRSGLVVATRLTQAIGHCTWMGYRWMKEAAKSVTLSALEARTPDSRYEWHQNVSNFDTGLARSDALCRGMINLKLIFANAALVVFSLAGCAGREQRAAREWQQHHAGCRKFAAETGTPANIHCRVCPAGD